MPLLQDGFRPFFLAGALWLAVATPYWLWLLLDGRAGRSRLDPLAWHQHEMLFGGIGAIVAGFLLTAVPNWTGRPALRGLPLACLAAWWAAARLANVVSLGLPPWLAPLLDAGFLSMVTGIALREVIAARNWRNLLPLALVGGLAIAALGSQLASVGLPLDGERARRLGIAAAVVLVALIGGRLVPNFTRNWLAKRGDHPSPAEFGRLDAAALALLGLTLLAWAGWSTASATGWLALVAGLANLVRLARWQGHRTLAEPLVAILHLGYLWLGLGATVLGLAILVPGLAALSGVHALTAGAIGTMTLAVMTRASLGHTGRALSADRATVAIYALVAGGALLRVTGDALGLDPLVGRGLAAACWSGAYLGFALHYGPMLLRQRVAAP